MANSGRTSLAATRALTDWATSGAAWLLVLSTTAVTTATAVVMAAGIGGAVVILTVLQRGYSCKAGVGRVFEHRIVMRATLLSGAAVILLDQTVDRGLGSAVLATALATGAVQAGRFVVDRMEDRLRIRGSYVDRVIVLADGSDATDVLDLIAEHAEAGWTILGCVGACAPEAARPGRGPHRCQRRSGADGVDHPRVDRRRDGGRAPVRVHLHPTPRAQASGHRRAGARRAAGHRPS